MLVVLAVLLLVIGYLSFCLVKVGPKERAVLTFFGDPIDVLEPGLHFRWWLLQELEKFPTEEQKLKYDWHEVTTRVGVYQGQTSQEEIEKLGSMAEKPLLALVAKAKKEREKVVVKQDEMTKQKYWVS